MSKSEYTVADDLEKAWVNFEPDLPLAPSSSDRPHPFYVERPGDSTALLTGALLRGYKTPPKYFFSGHTGCGKSTELNKLAADPRIRDKYWPVHFTIEDEAEVNDLDFKDVLLAIGSRLYLAYAEDGGRLPGELLEEINRWRGRVEIVVNTNLNGRVSGTEIEAGLKNFFANASVKMKVEPKTRSELRQVFERNLSELIDVINKISAAIQAERKRPPLVLIDDLDKPEISVIREIFYSHRGTMLQPSCPIVYTISSPMFYSPEFLAIRDRAFFLPGVRLYPRGRQGEKDPEGFRAMREFVHKRMYAKLISQEALDEVVRLSGGLFREAARLVRSSIGRSLAAGRDRIELSDVRSAGEEIRSEYRRILGPRQLDILRRLRKHPRKCDPEEIGPLLKILAALEYGNGGAWWSVHPVIEPILDEEDDDGGAP